MKLLGSLKFKLSDENKDKAINILASFVIVFLLGALFIKMLGFSPVESYKQLLKSIFIGRMNVGSVLEKFTSLLLTGLAFMVSSKAGFANIGVEGQMYLGAITAAWIGILLGGLPPLMVTIICILAAMLVGLLYSLIPALLKAYLNTNEICITIMLNYVAVLFTTYLVMYPLYCGQGTAATTKLPANIMLSQFMKPSRANTGVFLAVLALVIIMYIFKRTSLGYKMSSVGLNPVFSEYIGINRKKYLIIAVMISGLLGGLAGSIEVLGIHGRFINQFSNDIAFDGMLAALLAQGKFGALCGYSLFIAALKVGALGMERFTGIPKSLIDILINTFILIAAMPKLFSFIKPRMDSQKEENHEY